MGEEPARAWLITYRGGTERGGEKSLELHFGGYYVRLDVQVSTGRRIGMARVFAGKGREEILVDEERRTGEGNSLGQHSVSPTTLL